jgi:diguanylate cyclase (GGDEF)-like protein
MVGEDLDLEAALTVERLDMCNRSARRALPFSIVASVIMVVALGNSVSWPRKFLWATLVVVTGAFAMGIAFLYERRRRRGPVLRWRIGVCASFLIGLSWGSLVLLALPPPDDRALRAVVLVFAIGISAITVLSTAASRGRFHAVNLPMAGLLAIVYLSSPDHTTRVLGYGVPLFVLAMSIVHHEVHRLVMTNMRLRHELERAAMRDALTGLLNRRAFTHALEQAVAQAARSGELIGVLYLDVDRFKAINDGFGHAAGDATLVEVGRRLTDLLRAGDSCGRLGGDEFAVLVRGLTGSEDLHHIASRVVTELCAPWNLDGEQVTIAVSVGASLLSETPDADLLLRESDAAQYRAKRAGGCRALVYQHT